MKIVTDNLWDDAMGKGKITYIEFKEKLITGYDALKMTISNIENEMKKLNGEEEEEEKEIEKDENAKKQNSLDQESGTDKTT